MSELEIHNPLPERKYRASVPPAHQTSLDTRIKWMWNQRLGTIQMIWRESSDTLDHTAAMLILQAIMAKDLESISQIFQRIEGGALVDEELLERQGPMRI